MKSFATLGELETALKAALALNHDYAERALLKDFDFLPGRVKTAATLALFASGENDEPALLMTERTEIVQTHKGQMAFPGGACDPGEDAVTAALRETQEEVGVAPELVRVLGRLPDLGTVTGFQVTPVVALAALPASQIVLTSSPAEIASMFWIPFSTMIAPGTYRLEEREFRGKVYPIHVYQVGRYRIWGATASMIKNLLDRLGILG
jgi:8-oxo-dGTP pyrophosphatase MutT (NUDIX family)